MKALDEPAVAGREQLVEFYRQMLLIRIFEERSAEMYMRGKVAGFLHLYIGEEAIAVGAMAALESQDYIVTHYRDHGHALARGVDPRAIMAELFGKETGVSKGKGGSMHLFDASRGFLGGYAIVGGQLPIAAGLAFSSKYLSNGRATICFLGDGAVNQGAFHESLNLAALWKLPVLFFLENNGYGMGTQVQRACAVKEIYTLAQRHGIPARQVDGMDVLDVYQSTRQAVERVRSGDGPHFLEAITYRFRGHSMADPMEYRQHSEEEIWKKRDPIANFARKLLSQGTLSQEEMQRIEKEVDATVEEAVRFADQSPDPPPEALFQDVYAG